MQNKSLSTLSASLLWFGAAISIAEIMTGGLLAPLGFSQGLLAIILGHAIGGVLFYYVGLMGAETKTGAMESTAITFGRYGSIGFSLLNILQLLGWTAVMIISGANAIGGVVGTGNVKMWCVVITGLIILWVLTGLKNIGKINGIAVGALLVLSGLLAVLVFKGTGGGSLQESMTFGLALELSIAMPISWLPLISDYTKQAQRPVAFTLISTLSYFVASCGMYIIGLGAALKTGSSDIVQIMMASGLGIAALVTVILATVTTTYLDVHSAAESLKHIYDKWDSRVLGVVISLLGLGIAIITPIEQYQNFLYWIGSVFVPMASIMIADYFFNKNTVKTEGLNVINALLWLVGFGIYRIFLGMDTIMGSTIPVVAITMALSLITHAFRKAVLKHV